MNIDWPLSADSVEKLREQFYGQKINEKCSRQLDSDELELRKTI